MHFDENQANNMKIGVISHVGHMKIATTMQSGIFQFELILVWE